MNLFTRRVRTLLSALALAVCVSYGVEKPAVLVGQWVFADGYRGLNVPIKSISLLSDGTAVVDGAGMTWKVENERFILLTVTVGIVCDYKLYGDELSLTYDDNKNATFVRKDKLAEYTRNKEREEEQRIEKISRYFTDSRDGQKYRTVKIGGKRWMAENLNYQTGNSWCYGNDNSMCKRYGRLYDWNTAITACPAGWHVPSREEWGELAKAAGGTGDYGKNGTAGKALKSTRGWGGSGNGTDDFGFSGLPGGYRYSDDSGFYYVGGYGSWWTAKTHTVVSDEAFSRYMDSRYDGSVQEGNGGKSDAFSLRCLRDN